MGIEHIGIGAPFGIFIRYGITGQQLKHVAYQTIGMITVQHACPEVDFPTDAPPGSLVSTLFQCGTGSPKKFGVQERRNLITGIKAVKMGNMAMLILRVIHILKPFLQLAVPPDLHGRQLGEHLRQRIAKSGIIAHNLRSQQCVA